MAKSTRSAAADAIIVLGGGVNPRGFLPAHVKERVRQGVKLWKKNKDAHLIMSGGLGCAEFTTSSVTEAAIMKHEAVHYGIPARAISLEEQSRDTIGNIYYAWRVFLRPQRMQRVIIVTSRSHVRRVRFLAHHMLEPGIHVRVVGAPDTLRSTRLHSCRERERELLWLSKIWIAPLTPGDFSAWSRFIIHYHPLYMRSRHHLTKLFLHLAAWHFRH